jgi:8-oxo-dGTP diphosphatase
VPGIRLPGADYQAPQRGSLVDKHVDFWAMTAVEFDTFIPNDEVDGVAWVPVDRALQQLSYPRDERVLRAYAELPPLHRPVVLVRSAAAPPQAAELAKVLAVLRPGRLVSAATAECRDTLGPLSESLSLNVEVDGRFDVGGDPHRLAQALRELADPDRAVVVCTGETALASTTRLLTGDVPPGKGDGVVVSFARAGSAATVDPLTP